MRPSLPKPLEGLLSTASRVWSRASESTSQTVVVRLELPSLRAATKAVISLAVLGFAFITWAMIVGLHQNWWLALAQVWQWPPAVTINLSRIDLTGWPPALLAGAGLLALGTLIAHAFLPDEDDLWLKRLLAATAGLGAGGAAVALLAAMGRLSIASLNGVLALTAAGAIGWLLRVHWDDLPLGIGEAGRAFQIWRVDRHSWRGKHAWLIPLCLAFTAVMLYHALTTAEFDWDALVYHATMAKLMYFGGGIPEIVGPSVGLQLSANYPPLFPALGAFFYVESQTFNDAFLRALPPLAALLAGLATYKIGTLLGDSRYGAYGVVLLFLTPLFFYRSLFATNYMLLLALLTVALLFLLLGYVKNERRYWLAFGLVYGFALLTSYHALFFLPSIALILGLLLRWQDPPQRKQLIGQAATALLISLAIGSVWFIRNIVVVGNPIFPFGFPWLGGKNLDAEMLARTTSGIRLDSLIAFFGSVQPTAAQYLSALFLNKVHYPVLSGLTFVGLSFVQSERFSRRWLICLLFALFPFIIFASTLSNIFPRYFVLVLPPLALLAALVLVRCIRLAEGCSFSFVARSLQGQALGQWSLSAGLLSGAVVAAFIGAMAVFPASLALVGGKGFVEADWVSPAPDYLRYVRYTSPDPYAQVRLAHGPDVSAWQWLNRSLEPGERLATFENKVYYLADSRPEAFFYLDGWEAKELYEVDDPEQVRHALQTAGVRYILDPSWVRHWEMYEALPLDHYLGWPGYFPLVYTTATANVYQVGPVDDPLTRNSPIPVSLSPVGWTQPENFDGKPVRRLPVKDESARIYVGREGPITLQITYLDRGTGYVAVNLRQADNSWVFDFKRIQLEDSGEWRTALFVLATSNVTNLAELGLYASAEDLYVSRVQADYLSGDAP